MSGNTTKKSPSQPQGSSVVKLPAISTAKRPTAAASGSAPTSAALTGVARRRSQQSPLSPQLPPALPSHSASAASSRTGSRASTAQDSGLGSSEIGVGRGGGGGSCEAPNELMMEFIECVMTKDFVNAAKLCQMILLYEPNNLEALQFKAVIADRLLLDQLSSGSDDSDDDDDSDEDDDDDDDDDEDEDDEDSQEDADNNNNNNNNGDEGLGSEASSVAGDVKREN